MSKRDLLNFHGLSRREFDGILTLASELKRKQKLGVAHRLLAGKGLALVFEKPSLRTRATFAVGMTQLGGEAVYLGPAEVGLGTRETPADCARNLDRWFDLITVRTFAHKIIEEMAEHSSVPVINALTDDHHPCQALADLQVLRERLGDLAGRKLAWVGDGSSNVCHSLAAAAAAMGMEVVVAAPDGYEPFADELGAAADAVEVVDDPAVAVAGADAVVTDTFTSMGQEAEREARLAALTPYQVNARLLRAAAPGHVVLHCLPAHCGEEITQDVLWGESSAIWDEAENRLHAQKALLAMIV